MLDYRQEIENIFALRDSNPPISISKYMDTLKAQKIVLYGAGAFGCENLRLFKKYGVYPVAFLDQKAKPSEEKMGIPVYHPDDNCLTPAFRAECQVYISITLAKQVMAGIKRNLAHWGYQNVKEAQTVTARQVLFDGAENPSAAYLAEQKEKIILAGSLMGDEESVRTYLSCIKAHLLRQYENCVETDYPCQYFEAGVPLKNDFSCLIDCGAYNGDCLDAVLSRCGAIQTYIAFEPIQANFAALSQKVDCCCGSIQNAYLYPCGVADSTGTAFFTDEASASTMSAQGEKVLPIIAMDDAIKQVPATFVKMDIEGAEPAALRGAVRLIQRRAPDLAVSVYHAANHFWDIPCFIHKINPNYKMYLRSHTPATLESVLYCTC